MRTMKDSGIEWIGKIPENWNEPPLKSRYSFGKGLSITKADLSDEGAQVISYGQIHSKDNNGVSTKEEIIRHIPWNHSNLTSTARTQPGDLIFADTSEDLQGCGNCVYINREDVYAGYHTLFLHPKAKNSGRYFAYLFASDAWRAQIREKVTGVKLFSITQDVLKSTVLLEPPVDEQERIVQFLDEKCKSIDNLIDQKEKSITLLKERRQSIIYEAVTKGLDPNIPLKDSGIEWLGQIPEKWGIACLKRLGIASTGSTPSKDHSEYWDGDIPWVSPKDMKTDYLVDSEDHITKAAVSECGLTVFDEHTLLFCVRSGILRHTFPVCVTKQKVTINQDLRAMILSKEILPSYLFYYLRGINDVIITLYQKVGATVESIEMDWFIYLPVVLPSKNEQTEIVNYLYDQCEKINTIILKNNETITKLKEYRQSLIYEVVTGKKEIHNAVYKI